MTWVLCVAAGFEPETWLLCAAAGFEPETWVLPDDADLLASNEKELIGWLILKPDGGQCGDHIEIGTAQDGIIGVSCTASRLAALCLKPVCAVSLHCVQHVCVWCLPPHLCVCCLAVLCPTLSCTRKTASLCIVLNTILPVCVLSRCIV